VQPLLQRKSITYSECVSVILGIQQPMRMRYIICGLPGSTVCYRIISQTSRFKKKSYRT